MLALMQDTGSQSSLHTLVLAILTPLLAWLSTLLYDGFKTLIPRYDALPAVVHMMAAPLIAAGLGALASLFGLSLITDLSQIDASWINHLLSALANAALAAGIFRQEKRKSAADATATLKLSRASEPLKYAA